MFARACSGSSDPEGNWKPGRELRKKMAEQAIACETSSLVKKKKTTRVRLDELHFSKLLLSHAMSFIVIF